MKALAGLRRWYEARKLSLTMGGLILLLVFLALAHRIVISIPSGHAGVLWRRFPAVRAEAGTDTQHVLGEGITLKWPWDRVYVYNTRLQEHTETLALLSRGGMPIEVEISLRYKAMPEWLGYLHKHVGPDYIKVLVVPEMASRAAAEVAKVRAEELYSEKRERLEQAIFESLVSGFKVRFLPNVAVLSGEPLLRLRLLRLLRQNPSEAATTQQLATPLEVTPEQVQLALDALVKDGLVVRQELEPAPAAPSYRANRENLEVDTRGLTGNGGPLIYLEDVLIRRVHLPDRVREAIEAKLAMEQHALEYDARLLREEKEKERKRIEAEGIRQFQDIVQEGISDKYLKWKAIDATQELAKSQNSKMVFFGGGKDGLPVLLGPLDTSDAPVARKPAAPAPAPTPATAPAPATPPASPGAGAKPGG